MRTRFTGVAGIALTAFVLTGPAYADAIPAVTCTNFPCSIFSDRNITQPSENIILGNGVIGNPLIGAVANRNDVKVLYSSEANVLMAGSSGQAGLSAVGGLIHDVTVAPIEFGFRQMQVNPSGPMFNSDIAITAFTCHFEGAGLLPTSCVDPEEFKMTGYGTTNGNNRLSIIAPNGEAITSVTFEAPRGFKTLDQLRVSTGGNNIVPILPPDAVPEPSSMLLLASGLLVLIQVLRRKLKLGFWTRSA